LKNGFQIELIKGEGYYLSVTDREKFDFYMKEQEAAAEAEANKTTMLKKAEVTF